MAEAPAVEPDPDDDAANVGSTVVVAFDRDLIAIWLTTKVAPRQLLRLADQLIASGLTLQQLHPDTTNLGLAPWFQILVPDPAAVPRLLAWLRADPAVAAAFVKPPDALPG